MSLTPEEKRDQEAEARGDFHHCDPDVDYKELDATRDREAAERTGRDVHTEHCCYRHGCKYGKDDCSVETGDKQQSYPCEQCSEEVADPIRSALQSFVDDFEGDFVLDDGTIVDDPDRSWGSLTRLYKQAKKALDG